MSCLKPIQCLGYDKGFGMRKRSRTRRADCNDGYKNKLLDLYRDYVNTFDEDDKKILAWELALLHAQLGMPGIADYWLRELGFKYKLAPRIMEHDMHTGSSGLFKGNVNFSSNAMKGKAVIFDKVLDSHDFSSLRNAFSVESPFWKEHNYPSPNFFSYNIKLSGREAKASITQNNFIAEIATNKLLPLLDKHFPEMNLTENITSLEWWVHCRDSDTNQGHQMHFDLDEIALSKGTKTVGDPSLHPLISSVIYLVGNEKQAATLVTNQTLGKKSRATHGILCRPKENRALFFDGRLLHGVIPTPINSHTDVLRPDRQKPSPRITLMIGFWGKGVQLSGKGKSLGPNMTRPFPNESALWPHHIYKIKSATNCLMTPSQPRLISFPVLSPVWVKVGAPNAHDVAQVKHFFSAPTVSCREKRSRLNVGNLDLVPLEEIHRPQSKHQTSVYCRDRKGDRKANIGDVLSENRHNAIGVKIQKLSESDVEFLTIEELEKLKAPSSPPKQEKAIQISSFPGKDVAFEENVNQEGSVDENDENDDNVVFLGRFFLKSLDEIRTDIVNSHKHSATKPTTM